MEQRPIDRPEPEETPDPDLDVTQDLNEDEAPEPEQSSAASESGPEGSETPEEPDESDEPVEEPEEAEEPGEAPAEPLEEPAAAVAHTDHPAHHAAHAEPGEGRQNLLHALWPPRFSRNQLVVGLLLGILGAALAIQVRATNSGDQILRAARPDDLVQILDEVTSRSQKLDTELHDLQTQQEQLQNSSDKAQAALQQAQDKAKDLEILAGTVKAAGPGITVTITDPGHKVDAAALLNTLQELRAAGAEVVQLDNVRVVVSSAFLDAGPGKVTLDGQTLTSPYVFKVIGDPATLQPALGIPGGVVDTLKGANYGASTAIVPSQRILVDAIAPAPNPQSAKSG